MTALVDLAEIERLLAAPRGLVETVALARVVPALLAYVQALETRLEMTHVWRMVDGKMTRAPCEPGEIPDGIECRDETIRLQHRRIDALRARVRRIPTGGADMSEPKLEPLKACPFCEDSAILQGLIERYGICTNCNVRTPDFETAAEAVAAWNCRAAAPPTEAQVERAADAMYRSEVWSSFWHRDDARKLARAALTAGRE